MLRELYIGVMSGTSLDGIDISLCAINDSSFKAIGSKEYPYDQNLRDDVLYAIENNISLKEFGELDYRLGLMYSEAINNFLKSFSLDIANIKAIGLHGQTLWHDPLSKYPFSLQAGSGSLVAKLTGIDVVSDFRSGDIALGGEGAPFAPVFHREFFKSLNEKMAVLNLGGIANITILDGGMLGYDVGPANMLLDLWIKKHKDKYFDEDSKWAREGEVNYGLLSELLKEPFFSLSAPKSTGRELFNEAWLNSKLEGCTAKPQDIQRTLLELSVNVIVKEVKKYNLEILLTCGGGAKNGFLMELLARKLEGVKVSTSDKFGVQGDFMEAMAFAFFAYKRVHKQALGLKRITGASRDGVLGALYAAD